MTVNAPKFTGPQSPVRKCATPDAPPSLDLMDNRKVATMRHIGNLARQLKGDWSNMLGSVDLNDGYGAYRYQIAYGYFALALGHFHRLPAAPGAFKPTLERMIEKMLEPDVWWYWHDASKGGGMNQTPTSEGWVDPVVKDNIMYSAYLQAMVLLYNMLFDDDRYTKPGALTFSYTPGFWGPQTGFQFEYDQNSLNEGIYWSMVENGYLGVACEPYCVFQICNQVPIIGFRLHDAINGGSIAEEVTTGYVKAWNEIGLFDSTGKYNAFVATHRNEVKPSEGGGANAWTGFLMHSWNHELVEENYVRQRDDFIIRHDDETISVKISLPAGVPDDYLAMFGAGEFGWMAAWATEMGDDKTLQGMLEYADRHFAPRIQNGGLTFPRNDTVYDENGKLVLSHPIQGNSLLPLALLNVPNGLQKLYSQPWGRENSEHYTEPALTEVDFSVDVYRAVYVSEERTLLFDLAATEPDTKSSVVLSRIFGRGDWVLNRDEERIAWGDINQLTGAAPGVHIEQDGETLRLDIPSQKTARFIMTWSV